MSNIQKIKLAGQSIGIYDGGISISEKSIEGSKCAACRVFACCSDDLSKGPDFCAMKHHKKQIENSLELYLNDLEIKKMIIASVNTESKGTSKWTRVEDTIDFARQMGYKKIGIATCSALIPEAGILTKILEANGFEVESVCCKCGGIPKESIGVSDHEITGKTYARMGFRDPSCNPLGQALILNDAGTDFNILVGLCVGHDTLFIKHSKAPVTDLIAKDRRLFNNPAGALYGTGSLAFRYLLSPITLR